EGVDRWTCNACGSPIAARFNYLPDQIYVPLGVLDEADALRPERHCHAGSALSWLHISDDLPKDVGSGRASLRSASR
ncbi:MAG: GFA family protein, partial [Pseudomonadota bacterium]